MVLPAMRSIVRRRRGACHRAALRADPLAPPHQEGFGVLLPLRVNKKFLNRFKLICPSPARKKNPLRARPKSVLERCLSRPARGAYRDRHGRGAGLRWTRKRRARDAVRRAGFPVSDRRVSDERRICVRQNRVVLAPVAGVKPAEVCKAQPGDASRQFAGDGGKRNSSPGRARHKPSNHCAGKAGCPG
jgi:hypothetical protein